MKIRVDRFFSTDDATLSRVSVDGRFVCFGLEDEHRPVKKLHETRIPAGTYPVKLRTYGKFHDRYKERFAKFHEGMLWLRDVPGFTDILIHVGNTDEDTSGCLLVGLGAHAGTMTVQSSVAAYSKLYPMVVAAARDECLSIVIEDNDL